MPLNTHQREGKLGYRFPMKEMISILACRTPELASSRRILITFLNGFTERINREQGKSVVTAWDSPLPNGLSKPTAAPSNYLAKWGKEARLWSGFHRGDSPSIVSKLDAHSLRRIW